MALAICAQEMRTSPKEHGLAGNVQSVETTVVDTSTKSYKLRPDGREELESAIVELERYQQLNFFSKKGTERDHLKEYVEDLDKRIALILPHTQIRVLEIK